MCFILNEDPSWVTLITPFLGFLFTFSLIFDIFVSPKTSLALVKVLESDFILEEELGTRSTSFALDWGQSEGTDHSKPSIEPLAFSFLIFMVYPLIIVKRIKNEEKVLEQGLKEYLEYKKKVKYRLIPFIW